jgi:hypothetical protein
MILNHQYYQDIWNKYQDVDGITGDYNDNAISVSVKMILEHYRLGKPIHINFQNSKDSILEIANHLFVELSNDIYLNHYDLPDIYKVGDKLKKIKNNQYYEVVKASNGTYDLKQVLRKSKSELYQTSFSEVVTDINYHKISTGYVKVHAGISEKTIKNYFNFFKSLNSEPVEFPKTHFDRKSVFIGKKTLWDHLSIKNKIPSVYLPNPREENNVTETRSIPALSDNIMYFTPKYEVCYQKLLAKNEKIKSIVIIDTETDKIPQVLQDKTKYSFNLIILTNSLVVPKSEQVPCWNWFKEEINLINSI